MTGRMLYNEAFDFKPCLKLWIYGNDKPDARADDFGFWRRLRMIQFLVEITEADRDATLQDKLGMELPGILNWALEGVRLWQADGLAMPEVVTKAVNEYRDEEDVLGEFLTVVTEKCPEARTPRKRMYDAYKGWADENNLDYIMSNKAFTKGMKKRGISEGRDASGWYWKDIKLPGRVYALPKAA